VALYATPRWTPRQFSRRTPRRARFHASFSRSFSDRGRIGAHVEQASDFNMRYFSMRGHEPPLCRSQS
jgi:hypothetical protein